MNSKKRERERELWNLFVFSMEKLGYEVQFPVKKKKKYVARIKKDRVSE